MLLKLLFANFVLISVESNNINETVETEFDPNHPDWDVWPHPQSISLNGEHFLIDSTKFKFIVKTSVECKLLDKAIARYRELTFLQDCTRIGSRGNRPNIKEQQDLNNDKSGYLTQITIEINACEQLPHKDMNENYTISISKDGAFIRSQTNWGAIRGLETFSQFVKHIGINHFSVNWVLIEDSPRFQYRGLFIDTSVHYIPVNILYENLEAMSYNKLNVFHWHIVDDHSFPYVSQIYPNLSSKGAFDAETHVYTADDIKNIVEYARELGIRVLIELDTPSHTLSWGWSQTHLLTQCYTDGQPNGQYGPIDPTKVQNYKFIQNLFTEVIQLFPDEYFILGGDEVNHSCWESNPAINNFMNLNQITSTGQLEDYYFRNILPIVEKFKKTPVVSSELFDSEVNLKPNTIIDVYKGYLLEEGERDKIWRSELDNITKSNHKTILSSCWYLSPNCSFGPDWKQYYECEPHSFSGTEQQNKLVLGGETWAEFVDANNIISRLWPQAIAMAERLWSPKGHDNYIEAIDRFNSQQCLMQLRGLRVSLNNGHGFCKCDYAL